MSKMVTLKTEDDKEFHIDEQAAKLSETLSNMLQERPENDENGGLSIPKTSGPILEEVIRFLDYHKDNGDSSQNEDTDDRRTDDVSDWDQDFILHNQKVLAELIEASNYLKISKLRLVICKTVANMIKMKSTQEMKKTFGVC